MIPITLTGPPAPGGRAQATVGSVLRALVIILVLAALCGALAWYLLLSPFSFRRWSSLDIPPNLTIQSAGTYVLFEEYPGAASDTTPSDLRISVRSIANRKIDGTSLIGPDGKSAITYQTPFHEGRAVASFNIDKPGQYTVFGFSTKDPTGRATLVANAPQLALAAEGRPGWIGSLQGLVPLVIMPLVAALALGLFVRWRWPRASRDAAGAAGAATSAAARPALTATAAAGRGAVRG